MSPLASDFLPEEPRVGWSRCALPGGELRAETKQLEELERLGLLDLERWRSAGLGGVMVERKPDRWVCCLAGKRRTFVCRYRRRKRHGEWLERLLQRRALAQEPSSRLSMRAHASGPVVLIGEISGASRGEHETFQVSLEAVTLETLKAPEPELGSTDLFPRPLPRPG